MEASWFTSKPARIAFFLLSVIVLLLPAIRSGYPFLHGDSGVYIISGFLHFAPIERPSTYGLLVWMTSFQRSLWFVVLMQAVVTTFVIHIFLTRIYHPKYHTFLLFFIISILTLTTSLAIFVCQIKPDFFLPLILLAIFSFLIGKGKITIVDLFLAIIVLTGLISHLSHIPVITGLFLATFLFSLAFRKLRFDFYLKKYLLILLLLLSAWVIAPAINHYFTGSFKLSRVSNIFRVSRLLQAGVFQAYVSDRCKKDTNFLFCKYQSDLGRYKTYFDFLWDDKSFLYDYDCSAKEKQNCWLARNDEFGAIVNDIYSHQKYLKLIIYDAIEISFKQFFSFNIPRYDSYENSSFPMKMVRRFLPADNIFLDNSRQNKEILRFAVMNIVQLIVVIVSVIFIIFQIIWRKGTIFSPKLELLGYMIIMLLIGNALFVGIFAGASDRFQSRLIWLIPFYAIILFLQLPGIKKWGLESESVRC
jgi:hypothetical protein